MEVIQSDFERTISETKKAEAQAEKEHLEFMTETGKSLAEKNVAKKEAERCEKEQKEAGSPRESRSTKAEEAAESQPDAPRDGGRARDGRRRRRRRRSSGHREPDTRRHHSGNREPGRKRHRSPSRSKSRDDPGYGNGNYPSTLGHTLNDKHVRSESGRKVFQ